MRNKAFVILIGFILLVGLICFFWGNSFITWALEQSLQAIIGVKVDIERFRFNPFKLDVQIGSVRITNPSDTWKNIIDTKNIRFKLAPAPLFEGKTVIDEIKVEDLTFNTPRQSDGKLKKAALPGPLEKNQSRLHQSIAQMPVLKPETILKNLDTEKITASYQFKTDLSAERIKSELTVYQKKWDTNLDELKNTKVELKSLENKISQIKNLNSKNLLELKKQLDLVEEVKDSAKQIRTKIGTVDDQLKKDNQALQDTIKGLKQEAEEDYQSLLALAKVPDLGSINYAEAILGKTMLNTSTAILKIADQLQKSLPAKVDNPPKEKHPRGGQNITFPGRKTYPRFLIKKIAISGRGTPNSSMDGFYASGVVTGITSEPPIYGLPITAAIFAKAPNQASLILDGQLNHVAPAFRDQINLKLEDLPLPRIDFGDSDYLPSKLSSGKAAFDADVQITPDFLKINVLISGNNITSDYSGKPEPDDLIAEIVRSTIANLDQFTVNFQLEQIQDRLEMNISSDLNRLISSRLKEVVGEKVDGFTRELRAKVDAKLRQEQEALEATKLQYQKKLTEQLDEVRMQLDRKEQELQAKKKELEARIKKETSLLDQLKLKL